MSIITTAMNIRIWISEPAMWNTEKPKTQSINRISIKVVNVDISTVYSFFERKETLFVTPQRSVTSY